MIKSTTKKKVKKASSKKANPKKCRTIKVRRKISMGKGKRPRILQVRRKVCNPEYEKDFMGGKWLISPEYKWIKEARSNERNKIGWYYKLTLYGNWVGPFKTKHLAEEEVNNIINS